MPLHIKDAVATERAGWPRIRNPSLTEAVRAACEEALERDERALPVAERLADVHQRVRTAPSTGDKADKSFFDRAWREYE